MNELLINIYGNSKVGGKPTAYEGKYNGGVGDIYIAWSYLLKRSVEFHYSINAMSRKLETLRRRKVGTKCLMFSSVYSINKS